jgi:pyruvate/2-oxoglutarate dehydrogenase complex dihydrolipoamide acyltransferase (E2) component
LSFTPFFIVCIRGALSLNAIKSFYSFCSSPFSFCPSQQADECDAFVGLGDEEAYENCLVNSAKEILESNEGAATDTNVPAAALPPETSPPPPTPLPPAEPALKPWQIAQANAEAKRANAIAAKAALLEDNNKSNSNFEDGSIGDDDVVIVVNANSVEVYRNDSPSSSRNTIDVTASASATNKADDNARSAGATTASAPTPTPPNYGKVYPKLPKKLTMVLNEIATLKDTAMAKGATAEEAATWVGIDMQDLDAHLRKIEDMPSTGGRKTQVNISFSTTLTSVHAPRHGKLK